MRRRDPKVESRYLAAAAAAAGGVWWAFHRYGVLAWAAATAAMYGITLRRRVRAALRMRSVRRPTLPGAAGPLVARADRIVSGVWRAAAGGGRRGWEAARTRAGWLRARRARDRITRTWDGIAAEAGWLKDGRPPSLLGVDAVAPDSVRVTWRPWIGTDPSDYPKHAAMILRSIDAQTVRAHADLTRTGVAVAHIGLRVLPTMVRCHRVPGPAGVGPDAAYWLGPFAGGGDAFWRPATRPHLIVIGGTDKGKGGAARLLIAQAAIAPRDQAWDVAFLNTKRSGEAGYLARLPWAQTPSTPRAILDTLQRLEERRTELQQVLEVEGVDKWSDLPAAQRAELGWRRLLLVIDEMAALNLGEDQGVSDRIARLCAVLVMQMRSVGWHMIGMTQRPDVKTLGPFGGAFRSQLRGAYLIVGQTDKTGLGMVEDDPRAVAPMLSLLGGVQGRALGRGFDESDHPNVLQLGWLDQPTAVAAVGAVLAGAPPVDAVDAVDAVDVTTTPPPPGAGSGPDMDTVDIVDMVDTGGQASAGGGGTAATAVGWSQTDGRSAVRGDGEADPLPNAEGPVASPGGDGSGVDGLWSAATEQVMAVADLAAELSRSERQVRRYASGDSPPPAGVAAVRWVDRGAGRVAVRRQ